MTNKKTAHSKETLSPAVRGCRRKKSFKTRKKAISAVSRTGIKGMRPYKCWFCDNWHMTTQEKEE